MRFYQNLYMNIDIDKKQEVKTFFDLFTSWYLGKYFSEHSYRLFKFNMYSNVPFRDGSDSISIMFKANVNLTKSKRGRVFNRLLGMVRQAESYFKYLDRYRLNFDRKGAEYYLRLRLLGKYINKDTLLKRSVIILDVNYLKIYNNFFNRKKVDENINTLNKKLTKFQETLNEIYLDAISHLKLAKDQTMNNEITLKDNKVETKETSTENKLFSNIELPIAINKEKYTDSKELGLMNIKLKLYDKNFDPFFIKFENIPFPLKHFDFKNNLPDDIFKNYVDSCVTGGLSYSLSRMFEDSNIFFDSVYEMEDNVFCINITNVKSVSAPSIEDNAEILKVFKRSVELYIKYYKDVKMSKSTEAASDNSEDLDE